MAYLRDIGEKIYGSLYLGDNFAGKLPADLPDLADATRSNPLKDDDLDPAKQYAIWITEFPALGSLLPNPDGTFTYTPVADGTETAKYRVLEYNAVVGSEGTITLITGASSVTLVVQDLTQTQIIEVAPLSSGSYLITADMLQAQGIEAAPVTTDATLALADMAQDQTIDAAPLTTGSSLSLVDLLQAQTLDEAPLVDANTLQVADMAQAQSLDTATLSTDQVLAIADMVQAQTLEGADLGTAIALTLADLLQSQGIDTADVNSAPSLVISDMVQAQSVEALSDFIYDSWLQVQDLVQAQSVDNVMLTPSNPGLTLSPADIEAIAEAVWAKILTGPRIPGSAGSMLQDVTNRVHAAL